MTTIYNVTNSGGSFKICSKLKDFSSFEYKSVPKIHDFTRRLRLIDEIIGRLYFCSHAELLALKLSKAALFCILLFNNLGA